MNGEVVIVGADGQEHVFPAGFDPKRAAGLVRQRAKPQGNAPDGVVEGEPETWMGGYAKGLKEQFAPGAMLERGLQGARGVARGATDLINPLTYVETAKALPGFLRSAATTVGNIATGRLDTAADDVGGALESVASDPYSVGRIAGGFAAPGVASAVLPRVPAAMQATGGAIEKGAAKVAESAPGRFGLGGAVMSMDPRAMAIAVSPYAAMGVGKAVKGAGGLLERGAGMLRTRTGSTPPPAPMAGPAPKPKLSAAEFKQAMRANYGAEKGGRMAYGNAQPDLSASARTAFMREGTTGGTLPQAAQRAIDKKLAGSTAEEAFKYAAKAPNEQAQGYFGDILRAALKARMEGK